MQWPKCNGLQLAPMGNLKCWVYLIKPSMTGAKLPAGPYFAIGVSQTTLIMLGEKHGYPLFWEVGLKAKSIVFL